MTAAPGRRFTFLHNGSRLKHEAADTLRSIIRTTTPVMVSVTWAVHDALSAPPDPGRRVRAPG
jgi:hypothetical protein